MKQDKINLYKWNPVGVVPLIVASVLGTIAGLGFMGTFLQNTASFFAAVLASILTVVIAIMTNGKYYSKNESTEKSVKLKNEKEKKSPNSFERNNK